MSRSGTIAAAFALLSIWAIATLPWWWQGLVIPWDARNQFYPVLRWLADELAAGRLPDFMAGIYAGRPSLPDPQAMVTSPGFLTLAALDPAPSMLAMDMLLHCELLLGGFALLALGRSFGVHPVACLIGALVFTLGGAPMARLQHVLLVQSYAFIPVVLLALDFAVRRPTIGRGLLAGAAVGLLAVGRDHVALLGLYVVAGWGGFLALSQPRPLAWLGRALPAILAASLVAAVIALPPFLASVHAAAQSNRPAFPYWVSGAGGMCPACLLTLPFANIYDGLVHIDGYWGPGAPTFLWPNASDPATVQYYAGLAPLALAAVFVTAARGATPLQWFAVAVAAGALLYGMGTWTPLYRAVHAVMPGADLFRRASDASFIFNLSLGLLALAAAGRYAAAGLPRAGPWRSAAFVLVPAAVAATAIGVAALHGRVRTAGDDVLFGLGLTAVVALVLVWGARAGAGRRAIALGAIAALTAADLALLSAGTWLNAQPSDHWQVHRNPLADPGARALVARVEAAEEADGPVRVEMLGLGGPGQNLSLILGVENISGYNPLRPASYDRATGSGQNSHLPKRKFGEQMTGYHSPLTDLLGVRFLLLGAPMDAIDPASVHAFPPPERMEDAFLYENPRAIPRAVLVRADRTRPFAAALAGGAGPLPDLDWRTEALVGLAGVGKQRTPSQGPAGPAGALEVVAHAPGRLEVAIDPAVEGYVVLHELRAQGWTAEVDGEPRKLIPANGLFQAVPVRPGDRRVIFAFSLADSLSLWP